MVVGARILSFVLAIVGGSCIAQETAEHTGMISRDEWGLVATYRKEIGRDDRAPMHMIDLGIARGTYGRSMVTTSAWASVSVGQRGDRTIVAPRIGAQVGLLLSFGAELVYVTDLDQGSLQLVPSIGYVGYPLRIAIEPHVRLVNTEFEAVEGGCLSITYRFVTLDRRERKR
ncbi:MAG: hypothetical protein IPG92_05295 [Flavobacteriales bacterium]|nr:hypothetical protein [Flavobacteriales bacterium]